MIEVGIGLPTRLAATQPDLVFDWARRADEGPFSSLAVTDRVVSDALEPLAVLATAAGVTRRVRLMASVVIGPTRETTLLARQAATIDVLAGGRLSLGLAVGARRDDYLVAGTSFETRGRRFDEQLATLRRIWAGEPVAEAMGRVGPVTARPEGPELLVGGYVDAVAGRIARWADGFMAPGGGDPDAMARLWALIGATWEQAARPGSPRYVSGSYFALGPGAGDAARAYMTATYSHDRRLVERRLKGVPTTPVAVRALIGQRTEAGVHELILRPCSADLDQLDRLAEILGTLGH